MNVLGISCYYHDAAAALVTDGKVIAAVEEERFSRRKHDNNFPIKAINYCLNQGALKANDLDAVCFYEKPLRKFERVLQSARTWQEDDVGKALSDTGRFIHEQLWIEDVLRHQIGYTGEVAYTEHHLAHAASAFYPSGFNESMVLTIDGVGEWTTTGAFFGSGHHIAKHREIHYPDSIGLLYSTLTAYLGFKVNNDEYKVMGLSGYGQPKYVQEIMKLIKLFEDGSFQLNLEYFDFHRNGNRMYSEKLLELLGPVRQPDTTVSQKQMDIAASLQQVIEVAILNCVNGFKNETGCENLCLAGGVALNGVANYRVRTETGIKGLFVQPAAGDSGGALGAALHYFHENSPESTTEREIFPSSLYGPEFSNEEIESYLEQQEADYTYLNDDQLIERAAHMIQNNQIVGWCQGRMEFGPRALGNRSILANPCDPNMQETLNARVKFREEFRPFAPAVVEEKANHYFELYEPSPHMLLVVPVKEEFRKKLPAITHVDGSARVQTVSTEHNPRFHALIERFGQLSGVPVLINTSFNVRGEPIVCDIKDAYVCFMKTDIDVLFIGNFMVFKDV